MHARAGVHPAKFLSLNPENPMRNLTACAVACALGGCAALPPEVRHEEQAYQLTAAVDAMQTLRIADRPAQFSEYNPALGTHPAPARVAAYFVLTGVVHYGITSLLVEHDAPAWLIRTWEVSSIGLEAACIGNNAGHGIMPTLSFSVATDAPARTVVARHK